MRALIVCSGNKGFISNFVQDQVNALKRNGAEIDFYLIKGKGLMSYLKNIIPLFLKVNKFNPDVVHAHFGLSGLLCSIFHAQKLVTTYHGSDIHQKKNFKFSKWAVLRSKRNIFVTERLKKLGGDQNGVVIPCGVDLNVFKPFDKKESLIQLNLDPKKKYILFSSRFDFEIKNYKLAKKVLDTLNLENYVLLELLGYSRSEVALLMNACEFAFLTSLNEGSPQFIKEAMACNCPIVATNVGDVEENISGINGCYITTFEVDNVSNQVLNAISFAQKVGKTNARERLLNLGFDNEIIASKILELYQEVKSNT
jgi:glycosyltransferase involved in cell wall biosynthesis